MPIIINDDVYQLICVYHGCIEIEFYQHALAYYSWSIGGYSLDDAIELMSLLQLPIFVPMTFSLVPTPHIGTTEEVDYYCLT